MSDLAHFFTDADNTLWDTNAVYAQAQLSMLRAMERAIGKLAPLDEDGGLAFLRQLDQGIAAFHPDRLRYPPMLLVHALELALRGEPPEDAIAHAKASSVQTSGKYAGMIDRYVGCLSQTPRLRVRVREGLSAIAAAHVPITVVSEERLDRCERLLSLHSLRSLVTNVISISKTPDAFRQLKRQASADRAVMVGDQLDRDIRAAAAAGFETFYFPGGFQPRWIGELEPIRTRQISAYDEVVPYIVEPGRSIARA